MSVPMFPPRKDVDLLNWAANAVAMVGPQPQVFGVTPERFAAFSELQSVFAARYALATNLNTNSRTNVANKNVAREALLDGPFGAWELVNIIRAHPGTTDVMRNELGLRIAAKPSPTPRPNTPPDMSILSTVGRLVKVRLRDMKHEENRGKPEGVYGAAVLFAVSDTLPESRLQWHFAMNTSKPVFDVEIPLDVPAGNKVWLIAHWFNRKMQAGPQSQPKYTRVCDGAGKMAA